jgi:hypothetical protein
VLLGLPEPEALSVGLDDLYPMCKAVKEGASESFTAHGFGPVLEGEVCGDDQAVTTYNRL